MILITLFYILFTIMSHSKAQSPSSSSTLPVMSPFFKPRNDGKLCSQTSCPTSRTQLSCQGVTHTEDLIIFGKKSLFLGHLNNVLKGCSLHPSSAKPSVWFPVVCRVDSPLDNRVDSVPQQLSLRLQLPISWFSQLYNSLEAVLEVERKNMESSPTHPHEVILTSLHSVRS